LEGKGFLFEKSLTYKEAFSYFSVLNTYKWS